MENGFVTGLLKAIMVGATIGMLSCWHDRNKREKMINDLTPHFNKLNDKIDNLNREIEELKAKEA